MADEDAAAGWVRGKDNVFLLSMTLFVLGLSSEFFGLTGLSTHLDGEN